MEIDIFRNGVIYFFIYLNMLKEKIIPWYLYKSVTQNKLRTHDVKRSFPKKIGFDDSFDQQIEIPDVLHMSE